MSPENDAILCSKYPRLYRDRHGDPRTTAMCVGFDVGDGWFRLIDVVSSIIVERSAEVGLDPVATQIKEKFGTLRLYVQGLQNDEYLEGCIAMASAVSAQVCQVCGGNGLLRIAGWYRVLCEEHEDEYQAGRFDAKTVIKAGAMLTKSEVLVLLHQAIENEVDFDDLKRACLDIEHANECIMVRLESPKFRPFVEGMLAVLEEFASIRIDIELGERKSG